MALLAKEASIKHITFLGLFCTKHLSLTLLAEIIYLPPLEYKQREGKIFICLAQLCVPALRTNSLTCQKGLIKKKNWIKGINKLL